MEEKILLIPYDLQLFGDTGDKTEDATSKKIEDTRKKGQVGKSQELTHAISLLAVFLTLRVAVSMLGNGFVGTFEWSYGSLIPDIVAIERSGLTVNTFVAIFQRTIGQMATLVLPFLIVGFIVAALGTGLQFKFQVTFEPLKPKFSKLNPLSGVKRLFSKQALFNLGLSIAKIALISAIAFFTIRDHLTDIFILYELELNRAVALVGDIIINTGLMIAGVYFLIGFADFAYQKWKFKNDIKMTKQEVKDEYKNAEGDPQIKGQIKQRMREASQRRMMQSVPQADVVITNPTMLAVALKYDAEVANAPIIVAKGERFMAQRIRDEATKSNVPIVENKPLARMLYSTVEVGEQIPPELYTAVAEILAVIFNRRAQNHA